MFGEDNSDLREFYEQLPLGVCVEDYSGVKRKLDRLLSEGIQNLEQFFRDNPETLFDVMWEIETTDVNDALLRMFRVNSLQEYMDLDDDISHWKDTTDWAEFYTMEFVDFAAGNPHFGEYRDLAADGSPIISSCVAWIPSEHQDTWSVVITTHEDITERKKAEEALSAALASVEQSNQAKSSFLAHMSHELRTPLNAITGFSQLMTTEVFGTLGHPKYHEYAQDVLGAGEHLVAVINDILDIAKIEAGKIDFSPTSFPLHLAIEDCVNLVKVQQLGLPHRVRIDETNLLCDIFADDRMFRQILLNVLSNANKFTPDDGHITVTTARGDRDSIVVSITDTGSGIAPEDIATVLEPFGQVRTNAQVSHHGTGLGLPLCKKMMELHGGALELTSEVGVGTTVAVTFPSQPV